MDKHEKKLYATPAVFALGSPAEITQAGHVPNADVVDGLDNTAHPPGVGS